MDKYNYLIELSRDLPLIDPKLKVKENLINGCQSKVWLNAEYNQGFIHFTADSDAIITKGIIALLIRVMSDRTPEEIMNTDLYFIDQIGLAPESFPYQVKRIAFHGQTNETLCTGLSHKYTVKNEK